MKNNKERAFWRNFFAGVLGASLVGMLFTIINITGPTAYTQNALTNYEQTIMRVVEDTRDAVVSVGNYHYDRQMTFHNFEEFRNYSNGVDLGELEQEPVLSGTGSGVIYKVEDGLAYVISNNHVVEGADLLEITLANGDVFEAELVGSDAISDLALMTIPAEKVTSTAKFANSDEVKVGSMAIAIGSPLGSEFSSSVTQGIISGLNRSIPSEVNGQAWTMTLLQTDAAINPGNSGGALLNSQGELIGINSSKFASSQIEGMGFAIPVNDVVTIIEQIEAHGEVQRPTLGVRIIDLERVSIESRAKDLGIEDLEQEGVVIVEVVPGSAADQAGLQPLDVIIQLEEYEITTNNTLLQSLYKYKHGDEIEITVLREGETVKIPVTLTE